MSYPGSHPKAVLMETLRTWHAVEVLVQSFTPAGHLSDTATFQVANAASSMAAVIAVQQYVSSLKEWHFAHIVEFEYAKPDDVTLISVVPLSEPKARLFDARTLFVPTEVEQPQGSSKRQIVFQECTREESLHDGPDAESIYVSDGQRLFDFLTGDGDGWGDLAVAEGRMIYVHPVIGFTLPSEPSLSTVQNVDTYGGAYDPLTAGNRVVDAEFEDVPESHWPCSGADCAECQRGSIPRNPDTIDEVLF